MKQINEKIVIEYGFMRWSHCRSFFVFVFVFLNPKSQLHTCGIGMGRGLHFDQGA